MIQKILKRKLKKNFKLWWKWMWRSKKKDIKQKNKTNSLKNFKASILGEVFQGILKQDLIKKGNSTSNCQIEPFLHYI